MPFEFKADNRQTNHVINNAYGGAWAETDSEDTIKIQSKQLFSEHVFPMSLGKQVDNFILKNEVQHPDTFRQVLSHDLIFIWAGGNDYLNQAMGAKPKPRPAEPATSAVKRAIQDSVIKLINAGATNFVIFGLPDLSKIPDIILRDPNGNDLAPEMALTAELHNSKLQRLIADLSREYPQVHLQFFDVNQFFTNEFVDAEQRAKHYATSHAGKYQRASAPCLLESSDPDPNLVHLNPLLAYTTWQQKLKAAQTFRQCDLHEAHDQQSGLNFADHYQAGGMFFDHIHPITQLHAKIAISLCHAIRLHGYRFLVPKTQDFKEPNCDQYSMAGLMQHIIAPTFPTQ